MRLNNVAFAALLFVVGNERKYYYGTYDEVEAVRQQRKGEVKRQWTEMAHIRGFREVEALERFLEIKRQIEGYQFIKLNGEKA
ncbi:hypothetical protein MO973_19935 [Paenibacillus sp. TRM 82003]|nr:hypothetical protein [Paenibacillus sp. TRM 82003]